MHERWVQGFKTSSFLAAHSPPLLPPFPSWGVERACSALPCHLPGPNAGGKDLVVQPMIDLDGLAPGCFNLSAEDYQQSPASYGARGLPPLLAVTALCSACATEPGTEREHACSLCCMLLQPPVTCPAPTPATASRCALALRNCLGAFPLAQGRGLRLGCGQAPGEVKQLLCT